MKQSHWYTGISALLFWCAGSQLGWAQSNDYFGQPPYPQDKREIRDDGEPINEVPAEIQDLPGVEAKLKVIHHRSQLVIAKSKIRRTAVADPSVLDVVQYSDNESSIIGLELGTTTVHFWFDGSDDPLVYLVEVIPDPNLEDRRRADYGKLERKIADVFPNSRVYLIPLSGKIIVKGQARDPEEATRILEVVRGEVINQFGSLPGPYGAYGGAYAAGGYGAVGTGYGVGAVGNVGIGGINGFGAGGDLYSGLIVNMLEVPGEFTINLRVRMAELKREQMRRMGVNFDVLTGNGNFFSSAMTGGGNLAGTFDNGNVNVLLDALAANGTAKILTEPNVTTLSGHSATLLSGGEFAVPTIVGIGGAAGQQTQFRGFGVGLTVLPTVIHKDRIRMSVQSEFSKLDGSNVNGIPGTNVNRIQTTVDMREGQTLALAGLLSHQSRAEVIRVPFLGEVPVLGWPFNARRATLDETELIILITPELVRPMDADEVPPVPGYEVTHPNDYDLYKYNRTEGNPDQRVHQLPPFGHNGGVGSEVGYTQFNPAPSQSNYHPARVQPQAQPFSGSYAPVTPFNGPAHGQPEQSYVNPGIQPVPQGQPYGPQGQQYAPPSGAMPSPTINQMPAPTGRMNQPAGPRTTIPGGSGYGPTTSRPRGMSFIPAGRRPATTANRSAVPSRAVIQSSATTSR